MFVRRKDLVDTPKISSTGEEVYELIGPEKRLGGASRHSVAYVVIPPKCCSRPHFHNDGEETYFILRGVGTLIINDQEHLVTPGDTILISPKARHQIFAEGDEPLEFVVICAPPWNIEDNIFLDDE
jgi:mannose-6-phosphate isomerase-like protein (cupin superfamily)